MKKKQTQQKQSKNMVSSFQSKSSTTLDREENRKAKIIVKCLCEHNDAHDFKAPVDWKSLNLNDYPNIVKNPMDLGTIEKQLNGGKYSTVQQFIDDVQLIWDNCKAYNQAGSWIYQSAQKLQRVFKKMVRNYFPDIPITIPQRQNINKSDKNQTMYDNFSDEDITYYEKLNFCERIGQLQSQQLQKLVIFLQNSYPETLKQTPKTGDQQFDSKNRVQIVVDNFTTQNFHQINQFITKILIQKGQMLSGIKKVKSN